MIKFLEGAKWIIFAGLVFLIGTLFLTGKPSDTPFDEMETKLAETVNPEEMLEGDNLMVKRLYGLEPSDYQGLKLYYPATNMGAEELLLVQLQDQGQEQQVMEAIEERIANQKQSFDGYGIEQMGLLEHALIQSKGNYILFAVSNDVDNIRRIFLENL